MISEDFRPLLAATVDLDKVKFPCYVSPKLDGIRVLGMSGKAMTRSLKEVPNGSSSPSLPRAFTMAWMVRSSSARPMLRTSIASPTAP